MKKLLIVVSVTLAAACSAKLIQPTQSDVDRVSATYPGYTLTDLDQGKVLFGQTCNRCHPLKNPTGHTADQWRTIVPKMVGRLRKKKGDDAISDQQAELILRYLVTMSGRH
jgi:cytochrome c5